MRTITKLMGAVVVVVACGAPLAWAETEPAVTTYTTSVATGLRATSAELHPRLPLGEEPCTDPEPARIGGPGVFATLTATCEGDALALRLSGMPELGAGKYTGSLVVGETPVAVSVTRSLGARWFGICLTVGVLIALALRSFAGHRPGYLLALRSRRLARRRLGLPERWAEGPGTRSFAAAPAATAASVSAAIGWRTVWGRLRAIAWLLAPSTKVSQATTEQQARATTAETTLADWDALRQRLDTLARRPAADLDAEEAAILAATAAPPSDVEDLDDLRRYLDRVGAAGQDGRTAARLAELRDQLPSDRPPDSPPDLEFDVWRIWADVSTRLASLERLMARPEKTLARSEAYAAALDTLEADTYRILGHRRPETPAGPWLRRVDLADVPHLPSMGMLTPGDLSAAIGRGVRRAAEVGREQLPTVRLAAGDLLTVLIAVAVVAVVSTKALYLGQPWGTGWDLAGTVLGAAAGTVVLTPLLTALDLVRERS